MLSLLLERVLPVTVGIHNPGTRRFFYACLLELDHVGLSYHTLSGEIQALSQISFSVQEGEFVSLVGPSGCGKSTVLNLIAGLLIPEQGQITMQGLPREHSVLSVGYMLQKDHLFEWLTIYENVLLGLEIQKRKTKESLSHVDRLLQEYGLWNFRFSHPSQLSGGMRQRAALIRTLALEPALLLLDEPFSALDYQTRLSVSDDIWKILRKEGKTCCFWSPTISPKPSACLIGSSSSRNAPACVPVRVPHSHHPCRPHSHADAKCPRIQAIFSTDLEGVKS